MRQPLKVEVMHGRNRRNHDRRMKPRVMQRTLRTQDIAMHGAPVGSTLRRLLYSNATLRYYYSMICVHMWFI